MRGLTNRNAHALACLAVLGGAGLGGLAAGWSAGTNAKAERAVTIRVAEMAPADIVNLRFPAEFGDVAEAAAPAMVAFASADGAITLFNPQPTYSINPQPAYPVATAVEAAPAEQAAAVPPPEPPKQKASPPQIATANPAPARIALASVSSKPATVKPARSNAVLNDAQISSIKRRLNLTPDQQRYWPAVEAELRKMEYSKGADGKSTQGTRMASVDMSKVNVDGLKSAGFPLVMSFNDEQRAELKSLAHLLGLDSVMSGL
ncbi:MAG: hypothetical protein ACJ8F3_18400 [Xanthobacteraceae bacterium]